MAEEAVADVSVAVARVRDRRVALAGIGVLHELDPAHGGARFVGRDGDDLGRRAARARAREAVEPLVDADRLRRDARQRAGVPDPRTEPVVLLTRRVPPPHARLDAPRRRRLPNRAGDPATRVRLERRFRDDLGDRCGAALLRSRRRADQKGIVLECSKPLSFFLNTKISTENFETSILDTFAQLDDFDVMSAIKNWQFNDDFVLSSLSKMIINRDLLKISMLDEKPDAEILENYKKTFAELNHISDKEAAYFVFKGKLKNQAYNKESEPISILKKDKTVENIVDSSDQLQLKALSKAVIKYYMCFPKVLLER